jgi:hypothetical protein
MLVRCRLSARLLIAAALLFGFQSAMSQNDKPNLAFKYVGQGTDIKRLTGNVDRSSADGDRLIL